MTRRVVMRSLRYFTISFLTGRVTCEFIPPLPADDDDEAVLEAFDGECVGLVLLCAFVTMPFV